ncbi:MAG TPA: ATP-dependent DNA helicase [Streptosporangiaceae bacterium]|nr:ATP-dependent DNA helicase [Streptosporangiaceae bacterium]
MAAAVHTAMESGQHLAVQAGTGTGKSLAYLVPAVRHALAGSADASSGQAGSGRAGSSQGGSGQGGSSRAGSGHAAPGRGPGRGAGPESSRTVVVSTATIALQRQLIERDLPRLAADLRELLGREPAFAILKGRRNYLCLNKVHGTAPDEPEDSLFDPRSVSAIGRQVTRLHEWAATTSTGDRDELVPGVDDRAWRQVSVNARECIGAQKCPFGTQCFTEHARETAGEADIVVTNHALLAIDAMEDYIVLPEHDVVVIDEAHDLVDRVTSVASGELSASGVEAAVRRCGRLVGEELTGRLRDAGEGLRLALGDTQAGRIDLLSDQLELALATVRDAAAACAADLRQRAGNEDDTDKLVATRTASVALDEVAENAERMVAAFASEISARPEVVWLDRPVGDESARPDTLRVAPLQVGGLLAERLFKQRTVVLTSATLTLGGSFEPLARQWGLPQLGPSDSVARAAVPPDDATVASGSAGAGSAAAGSAGAASAAAGSAGAGSARAESARAARSGLDWTGLDVGSPFDHRRSGILYVARHLPPPGRDGLPDAYLTELRELIAASGGRTLGLFSSMRAARQAADALRADIGVPLLCQGEDSTGLLVSRFAEDETSCLFGTLSLWQGVDVPGQSLQLVVIDRIPFPRPDDPLASARQRAVAARGGNGFMAVAAAQAALLLAQGTGRLLRTIDDRGVIAILDPRLATARYGSFLRLSLPPYWSTYDPQIARNALRRLAADAAAAAAAAADAAPADSQEVG